MNANVMMVALGLLSASASSHAFKLIGDDEARLPAAAALTMRGITRGPGIRLVSPDPADGAVKAPFNLKVAFEPRGGAKIDATSVTMTYLRSAPVDLIERIKPGLSAHGIDLSGAEAPPGEHLIQISVQDTEGRRSSTVINLMVAK